MGRERLMLTIVLLAASAIGWAESPATLLEKGFYKEQSVGDLDGAIAIYRKIIADAAANRRYVAEAHLRLGVCLMKKGRTDEGIRALKVVIEKYADRPKLVARARKHLPEPAFPEFVGCRIKETLELRLEGKAARAAPARTIARASHLVINWTVAPALAKKARSFAIAVQSTKIDSSGRKIYIWKAQGLDGGQRSIVFAQSSPDAAKLLVPGEYTVFVCAYGRPDAAFDPLAALATARAKLTVTPLTETQILVSLLEPDGTLRFRSISQEVNRSGKPMTELGFMNSDFVQVEHMSDDAGRPLSFTTTHRDGTYHYRVKLNQPVGPGEPVMYCSGGVWSGRIKTDGDLHVYHMRHWPMIKQPTRRIEIYHLPAGAELIATTPPTMARRVRDGRLELFVEKTIPAGGSITTSFKYRLRGPAAESRKAYIPDADTKDTPVILDLATGEMLPPPNERGDEEIMAYFRRLGKGDLAFDRKLVVIRGGKAEQLVEGKAAALTPQQTHCDATAYKLPALPAKLLVTTGDGKEFEVTVLGLRGDGIDVEYTPRPVPARAAKAYIPKGVPIVLDLATGEMLTAPQGSPQELLGHFRKIGKGDLAYDKELTVIRGGKAGRLVGGKAVAMTPDTTQGDATAYRLPDPPAKLLVTTGDGKTFQVTVLDVRAGGIDVEYTPADTLGIPAGKLDIGPAPWADGEIMRLMIKTKTGVNLGMINYTARMMPKDPKAVATGVAAMPGGATAASHFWRIESYMAVPMRNLRQFTRVDADLVSFTPSFGWTRGLLGDFRADYRPGKVALKIDRDGKTSTQQTDVREVVYDNEQVLYLIRRLPLKVGYRASIPIFTVQGGVVITCRIRVVAREKATWAGGQMDCHKVVLSLESLGVKALEHTLWFSADEHRWLVRYDAGTADMVLLTAGRASGKPQLFKIDREAGFTLPIGFHAYPDEVSGGNQLRVVILPPELAFWSVAMGQPTPEGVATARELAGIDAARGGGLLTDYKVRPDSWREGKISALPAASYVADYTDKGRKMVEYRTYLLAASKVYWFVFRTDADKFDAQKGTFDKIVNGLTYKGRSGLSGRGD